MKTAAATNRKLARKVNNSAKRAATTKSVNKPHIVTTIEGNSRLTISPNTSKRIFSK